MGTKLTRRNGANYLAAHCDACQWDGEQRLFTAEAAEMVECDSRMHRCEVAQTAA